jgi:hypothetical protein
VAHKTVHVGCSFFGECKCAKMMLVITSSSFFLINSYLLSNFLLLGTFIVSCEWTLLDLHVQSFEFFEPKNSEAKGI